MPNWKKVVVSGSRAHLNEVTASGVIWTESDISGSTIRASGDIIAFNSSDERLKDNITYIGKPLEKIEKIGGYDFDWNKKQDIYSEKMLELLLKKLKPFYHLQFPTEILVSKEFSITR